MRVCRSPASQLLLARLAFGSGLSQACALTRRSTRHPYRTDCAGTISPSPSTQLDASNAWPHPHRKRRLYACAWCVQSWQSRPAALQSEHMVHRATQRAHEQFISIKAPCSGSSIHLPLTHACISSPRPHARTHVRFKCSRCHVGTLMRALRDCPALPCFTRRLVHRDRAKHRDKRRRACVCACVGHSPARG